MARTASTVSQRCSSVAIGWSRSSFPVFFLYSLKAASRIGLKFEGGIDVWGDEDIVSMTGGSLVTLCSNSREFLGERWPRTLGPGIFALLMHHVPMNDRQPHRPYSIVYCSALSLSA